MSVLSLLLAAAELVIVDDKRSLTPLSEFRGRFEAGMALLLFEPIKLLLLFPPHRLSQEGLDNEVPRFLSNSTHSLGFSHSEKEHNSDLYMSALNCSPDLYALLYPKLILDELISESLRETSETQL